MKSLKTLFKEKGLDLTHGSDRHGYFWRASGDGNEYGKASHDEGLIMKDAFKFISEYDREEQQALTRNALKWEDEKDREELKKALEESFGPGTYDRLKGVLETQKKLVKVLGDRIGYGRVIQLAEEIWAEKDPARAAMEGPISKVWIVVGTHCDADKYGSPEESYVVEQAYTLPGPANDHRDRLEAEHEEEYAKFHYPTFEVQEVGVSHG